MKSKQNSSRYNIRVLDRAILILNRLSDGVPRTLAEISEEININTSTTYRLLMTLASHNFVSRDAQTNQYRLGLACLELAKAYQDSNNIRRFALPELEKLRDDVKETVHLAVLDHWEVVYLEKLSGLHAIGLMGSRVGGRAPVHCTGLGKAIAAFLDPAEVRDHFEKQGLARFTQTTITSLEEMMQHLEMVRQAGYALDRGEHENEVRCVAVPIFDIDNKVVAALSVSGPAGRMEPMENNPVLIEKARQSAERISSQLGYVAERID
jgi:IclR family KDG regulon transcriptional repressor